VTDDDLVFKALADPTRRLLLDRLFERDGRTLTELESEVDWSSPENRAGKSSTSSTRFPFGRSTIGGSTNSTSARSPRSSISGQNWRTRH